MIVRGDHSHLVGIVAGEMSVYEDEDVGDGLGEGDGLLEEGPGTGVRVDDDG